MSGNDADTETTHEDGDAPETPADIREEPDSQKPPDITASGKKKIWELTSNALVVALVSAIIGGFISLLVSLLVARYQNEDAASQAYAGQQTQAAEQMEAAANALYLNTMGVYYFQVRCANGSVVWMQCAGLAPGFSDYSTSMTELDTDINNISDPEATELANQFGNDSIQVTSASSASQASGIVADMLTAQLKLVARCGQLVHG
jgi:hypothetical protein